MVLFRNRLDSGTGVSEEAACNAVVLEDNVRKPGLPGDRGGGFVSEIVFIAKESDPNEGRRLPAPSEREKTEGAWLRRGCRSGAGPQFTHTRSGIREGRCADRYGRGCENRRRGPQGRRPTAQEISGYRSGAVVIAIMDPYGNEEAISAMAGAGLTTFAMELMPRITRAQSMDVLSSQANLAGYQAVIDAAYEYDRALPMMMTAAGTVPAAKVFVMGAGVAGLQAIATARRLGAVVSATDVRPAAKEQVASLGAKFIAVEDEEFKAAETAGGYAKEMSEEYRAKQAALVAEHIAKQDIVITHGLIPGRPGAGGSLAAKCSIP